MNIIVIEMNTVIAMYFSNTSSHFNEHMQSIQYVLDGYWFSCEISLIYLIEISYMTFTLSFLHPVIPFQVDSLFFLD